MFFLGYRTNGCWPNIVISYNRSAVFLTYLILATYWLDASVLALFAGLGILFSFFILIKEPAWLLLCFLCYLSLSLLANLGDLDASIAKAIFIPYGVFFLFYLLGRAGLVSLINLNRALVVGCFFISVNMFFQESPGVYVFSAEYALYRERWMGYFVLGVDEPVAPNVFSQIVGIGSILSLNLVIASRIWHQRVAYAVLALCFLFFVVSSGSRSVLVASVVCSIILVYFNRSARVDQQSKGVLLVFYGLLFVLFFGYVISFFAAESQDISARMSSFSDLSTDHSFMTRVGLWADALTFAAENPLGGVLHNFFDMYYFSPHNEVLGVLLLSGYLGAFFYILLWFGVGKVAWLAAARLGQNIYISAFVFTVFVSFTEHFTFSSGRFFAPIVFAFFGYMIGAVRFSKINFRNC